MFNKKFSGLFIFYVTCIWFSTLSSAILPTYFLTQHITYQQMVFGVVLKFISSIILLVFLTKFSAKLSWRLSLISYLAFILLSIQIHNYWQFYLAYFISGFSLYFFFVFYNIAHFENTQKENRGYSSALMFIAPSAISIFAPFFAGIIAQISFQFLWILSAISFTVSFYLVSKQNDFTISYQILSAIREIKSTRIFLIIEGVWESLILGIVPVYTLFFIKAPLNYGLFLAYLALISIVFNFLLGKLTDKLQKRIVFLYPLTIVLSLTTILMAILKVNLPGWIIGTSAISVCLPLFWNISTAMIIDSHPNLRLAIPGRELMLAIGRVAGLLIAFLSFTFEKSPFYVFIILGVILLFYPLVLFWRTKIKKDHQYL